LIQVDRISKSYGAVQALKEISFEVPGGASCCLLGRSGCGKTTALKISALIAQPDTGTVSIDGTIVNSGQSQNPFQGRRLIGYSFQEPLLLPFLNALENSVLSDSTPESERVARDLLSKLGLSGRMSHAPSRLSVGEKKRVDIARALLRRPKVLIADEPFSSLDPDSRAQVSGLFDEFLEGGGTLLYSAVDRSHSTWAKAVLDLGYS
jgi:ABC-type multidrug transport system ATPase subunit